MSALPLKMEPARLPETSVTYSTHHLRTENTSISYLSFERSDCGKNTGDKHTHKHTHTNQYVTKKMIECYEIKGYTDREVTANTPDIIIKHKKRENTHTCRCGNTCGQKCYAKRKKYRS